MTQNRKTFRLSSLRIETLFFFLICSLLFSTFTINAAYSEIGLQTAIQKLRKSKQRVGYSANNMERCLTPYISIIVENWNRMPAIYRQEFQSLFQRPDKPGSFGSLQGLPLIFKSTHFRYHYTITGPDAVPTEDISPMNGVPDYIDVCADAFERAYHIEVDMMGFKKPLNDFWMPDNGGDEKYDVYFFSGPWGGFTMPEWPDRVLPTAATYIPYFGMNSGIYDIFGKSEGKRFLENTAAHEFLHSIQFSYNVMMPRWFMEATSTWIESIVNDGGLVDDGDDIDDPDYIGETDAYNDYSHLLRYWFIHPDWALDVFDGWHEYADVIWVLYLVQRFGTDIVRQVYQETTEGSYREMGNFYDVMTNHGTTLAEAFKTFTVWNYFTGDRDDGKHYFNGNRFPPVAVHLDDVHNKYPVFKHFDSQEMPEHFSSRYVVFEPSSDVKENFAIRVNGGDINDPEELSRLRIAGLRGWGAKLIIEESNGSVNVDEIFTFSQSQEGQKTFQDFGTKIKKITLVLINLHPDIQREYNSISYAAGPPPAGKLSIPTLAQDANGKVIISWDLLDISGIKEVAIVRKRYAPSEDDMDNDNLTPTQALHATDKNGDGIPDGNIEIVGRVPATDTKFEDVTIFADIDTSRGNFDATEVRYYYTVVPVNEFGIMGSPSIADDSITPVPPRWINTTWAFLKETSGTTILPPLPSPSSILLFPNYPNPFNAETWIPYKLYKPSNVVVNIYSATGELVKRLDLGYQTAGIYADKNKAVYWNGKSETGENVASGMYFYVIKAGEFQVTRKMYLVK